MPVPTSTTSSIPSFSRTLREFDRSQLPAFPDDNPQIKTHPLLVIDYQKILEKDEEEEAKFWKAMTGLGFFYLKNHGVDPWPMWEVGYETMRLPMEEKMKYEQGSEGMSHGYKAAGVNATDETGNPDTPEFINISLDDSLSYPTPFHREYPSAVAARMASSVRPFTLASDTVLKTLLNVSEKKLGMQEGSIVNRHKSTEGSIEGGEWLNKERKTGSEARVIKNPGKERGIEDPPAALGAHTDFGTLSFLHNILGGLQVMPPGTSEWQYIKPLDGHAICNAGDALAVLSGGIIKSNIHRVITPPPPQNMITRWSLVYFIRPLSDEPMRPLVEASSEVKAYVESGKGGSAATFTGSETASQWFARRVKNQRLENRTGPETWQASRGTEHTPGAK